jgi:hypothetical protein
MSFIVYSPIETLVNDLTFGGYHKFGSESRMLTSFEEIPDTDTPKSGAGEQPPNRNEPGIVESGNTPETISL